MGVHLGKPGIFHVTPREVEVRRDRKLYIRCPHCKHEDGPMGSWVAAHIGNTEIRGMCPNCRSTIIIGVER